ncbi:hypothetical protein CPB84DRAFT_1745230 [Gymnopilus junonius]|uniref:Uncharacterized protein n=1 Tax=Gymnopilus junonius TaxID=109634 RepID=A0A9P5TR54_GYMJU|nr:hypothetical protein CPB84DRAFT_1745230 [Gymnopilus junonius]
MSLVTDEKCGLESAIPLTARHSTCQPQSYLFLYPPPAMRFFKAFNLLHRRTTSATFVPAGPHFSLGSPDPTASLSLFDLIASRRPFSDLKDDHWWSRRSRDMDSMASLQPPLMQECRHLVEPIDFWIEEYSKIRDLLKRCHAELLDQRSITIALERKINENSQEMAYLRTSLALAGPPATPAQVPNVCSPAANSQNITTISTNSRTLDQYYSALRMTLQTRKALREQKKISKYWKNLAVTGGQQNTVTPSVSAVSSVRETLPAHRQEALEALIARRGVNTQANDLRSENNLSQILYNTSQEISRNHTGLKEIVTTLPSSLSNGSQFSRLGPLASESVKHEAYFLLCIFPAVP